VLAFLSLLDIYLLNNWLPTIINSSGLSINQAALATSAFQIGGIAGGICLGMLVDRLGPVPVIASSYLAATLLIACAAYSSTALSMSLAAFGAGFMVIGAQNCNNAVNANLYPTSARATALGWSLTVGRIGSVLGPLFAGMLLARGVAPQKVLLAAAIPTLCAALVMLLAGAAMKRANINLRVDPAEKGVLT
jgi:AAHS family 4-hydroxybenzoate transporter-like MFS transporter